jgi:hypothetical protein
MQKAGSRFPEGLLIRLFLSPSACPLFLGRRTPYRTVHLNSTPPLAQVHIVRTAKAIWFSQPPAPPLSSLAGPYLVTGAFCPWCSCDDLSTLFILCIAVTSAPQIPIHLIHATDLSFYAPRTRNLRAPVINRSSTGLQSSSCPAIVLLLRNHHSASPRPEVYRVYDLENLRGVSPPASSPQFGSSPVPSPQHIPALGLFRESAGLRLFAASSAQLPQSS